MRVDVTIVNVGEVALPGGKREEGDVDDSATALREAMEEIGLNPSLICIVSVLEPFISQVGAPFFQIMSCNEKMKRRKIYIRFVSNQRQLEENALISYVTKS